MKKSIIILFASSLLILISAVQDMADPGFFDHLKEKLAQYHELYPEEKLYVQTDKPFYEPGDDIWFNVFVLNSNDHKPTRLSDVVYVDLIDPKGNVAKSLHLLVREGTANGDFKLPKSDKGGGYEIRAYTQWMKNFGEEQFFTKNLPVQRVITPRLLLNLDFEKEAHGPGDEVVATLKAEDLKNQALDGAEYRFQVYIGGKLIEESDYKTFNEGEVNVEFKLPDDLNTTDALLNILVAHRGIEESISRSVPIVLNNIKLSFFPEGGYAIAGVPTHMAFKALNEFNKGADVAGAIVDAQGTLVANFESFHMGMGAVELSMEAGKEYFARIDKPLGDHPLIPLPPALTEGLGLNLTSNGDDQLVWSIYSSFKQEAYLVATTLGKLSHTQTLALNEGVNQVKVNTSDFPMGISVFTLFDQDKTPKAERLVFLNQDNGLNIELKTDKDIYAPREPVKLSIKTTDGTGKPVVAKLSLAAVDDQLISFADDKQDHLLSQMFLSTEVKGEVQEPTFYFDPEEEKAGQALDYLLMTQGWRRFSWNEVENPQKTMRYTAERLTDLSGYVRDKQDRPLEAEVTLLELGGKQRIVTVQTTPTGNFIFRNVDPQQRILLLTKKPGKIYTDSKKAKGGLVKGDDNLILGFTEVKLAESDEEAENEPVERPGAPAQVNVIMNPDAQSLGEVVVTGFGYSERENLAFSMSTISNDEGLDLASPNLSTALSSQVAGLQITNASGIAGSATQIRIRGVSSLNAANSPLFVIDGYPVDFSSEGAFDPGSLISPDDIESINIIRNSASATAIYGSRGSNGIIQINTKRGARNGIFKTGKKPNKYNGKVVTPRQFSGTRVFYSPPKNQRSEGLREDFRKTVYWNHQIITNDKGEAYASFYNTDAVSAFRLTAEGFTGQGDLGRTEQTFATVRPLSLDVRFPAYLGYEDQLTLPVTVTNETQELISGDLDLDLPEGLLLEGNSSQRLNISAGQSEVIYLNIKPDATTGAFPVKLSFTAKNYTDEIRHTFNVRPIGFPRSYSLSGRTLELSDTISLNSVEANSLRAQLHAFPVVLNDLFSGAESIIRKPYGCFEQVSSSNYPNILALQYMREAGQIDRKLERKALNYLSFGYAKLTSYEVPGGGFDWFGRSPAHAGLTAFGLVQFAEMKKVMNGVSDRMINRTRDWLMSQRDGEGGFYASAKRFHGNGTVDNAYIVFGLTQTGEKNLELEYNTALADAEETGDMYKMALMALSAYNLGKTEDYNRLIASFKAEYKTQGFDQLKAGRTVYWGYGSNLRVELTALWALVLLRDADDHLKIINEAIEYISARRRYGGFGSTQATALALQALTKYARLVNNKREDGEIELLVNGQTISSLSYTTESQNQLSTPDIAESILLDQAQEIKVEFKNTAEPLPFSVDLNWYSKLPPSSEKAKLRIETKLAADQVKTNETVRLSTSLKNVTNADQAMPMAIIGIPAGLSVQPWQLKELQDQGAFDFYEFINGRLVLYYRSIDANQVRSINLDLKADVPGQYQAAASSAYLYYDDEYKHYVAGEKVVINP